MEQRILGVWVSVCVCVVLVITCIRDNLFGESAVWCVLLLALVLLISLSMLRLRASNYGLTSCSRCV